MSLVDDIPLTFEAARGCGYRKAGGKYLVSGGEMLPCGRLPLELTVCPCCSQGIKQSRGWTWIDPEKLLANSSLAYTKEEAEAKDILQELVDGWAMHRLGVEEMRELMIRAAEWLGRIKGRVALEGK